MAGVDFGSGERFANTDTGDGLIALFTDYDSKRPNDFSSNADRQMLADFRESLGQVDKKLRTHVPDVDYHFYAWRGPITNLKPAGDDKTNETLHTHGRGDFCGLFQVEIEEWKRTFQEIQSGPVKSPPKV